MDDSNGLLMPEGPVQGPRGHDDLRAVIQEAADILRDLKQRTESRHEQDEQDRQNLRRPFAQWERGDARSDEKARKARIEEYERRMREQDARIEENLQDIERRLDALERDRGEAGDVEEGASEG